MPTPDINLKNNIMANNLRIYKTLENNKNKSSSLLLFSYWLPPSQMSYTEIEKK